MSELSHQMAPISQRGFSEPYECEYFCIEYSQKLKISIQTVHGGLIMSLTDTLGSLALATKDQYMTGVSTDIGATFPGVLFTAMPGGRKGVQRGRR